MRKLLRLSLVVACASFLALPAMAQEWTRFRGPNGTGLANAKSIPVEFGEKDFNWKVKLPAAGHSSAVLWGEKIFLTGADEREFLFVTIGKVFDGNRTTKHDFVFWQL